VGGEIPAQSAGHRQGVRQAMAAGVGFLRHGPARCLQTKSVDGWRSRAGTASRTQPRRPPSERRRRGLPHAGGSERRWQRSLRAVKYRHSQPPVDKTSTKRETEAWSSPRRRIRAPVATQPAGGEKPAQPAARRQDVHQARDGGVVFPTPEDPSAGGNAACGRLAKPEPGSFPN
jgi:hypothetical protein